MTERNEWTRPRPKSVNGAIYADISETVVGFAAQAVFTRDDSVWQGDHTMIHRCPVVLQAVSATYRYRMSKLPRWLMSGQLRKSGPSSRVR